MIGHLGFDKMLNNNCHQHTVVVCSSATASAADFLFQQAEFAQSDRVKLGSQQKEVQKSKKEPLDSQQGKAADLHFCDLLAGKALQIGQLQQVIYFSAVSALIQILHPSARHSTAF